MSDRGYRQAARVAVRRALREDLAGYGDLTGSVFEGDGVARVVAREAGVLSGVAALRETVMQVDGALTVEVLIHDGERFSAGDTVAVLRGRLAAILAAERTALNFLCHLSGVATLYGDPCRRDRGDRGSHRRRAQDRRPGCARSEAGGRGRRRHAPRFGLFDGAMIKATTWRRPAAWARPSSACAPAPRICTRWRSKSTRRALDDALAAGAGIVLPTTWTRPPCGTPWRAWPGAPSSRCPAACG